MGKEEINSLDAELWNRLCCRYRIGEVLERHLIATSERGESSAREGQWHREESDEEEEEEQAAAMSRS